MEGRPIRWKAVFRILMVTAGAVAAAGGIFIWSGLYNVAASKDHLGITTWLLEQVREQSVATHAWSIEPPPLDDDGMIRLGAAHFEGGCVPCHNRPGQRTNPVVAGMLPAPPELTRIGEERDPQSIFWIVKHGLKYTGMPAWPSQLRDDEVWAVTAFLNTLPPRLEAYVDHAGLARGSEADGTKHTTGGMDASQPFRQCGRCHDGEGLSTNGDRIPRLAGESEAYLLRSLREYAARLRPSGVMQPVAALLTDQEMEKLAAHYAGLPSSQPEAVGPRDPQQVLRGRDIAERGDRARDVPACLSCHSAARSGAFPRLAGQHAAYAIEQLRLWKRGGRDGTTHGRIMATIAARMTDEQIVDVSLYFASQPPEALQDLAEDGS